LLHTPRFSATLRIGYQGAAEDFRQHIIKPKCCSRQVFEVE
jgi:hypothetical protein